MSVRRVQRVPEAWPVVHLERDVPEPEASVTVEGLVGQPVRLDRGALEAIGPLVRPVPVHCVWGWSRPHALWEGVALADVLDLTIPLGGWVTLHSASGAYSSCMSIADAARGLLAWGLDGEPLLPEAGGPLRFVGPPDHWAYKHVKWVDRITVGDRFVAGFWESKVADPVGRIPGEVELP
jgi:DMSO/TMAO reductase YedYZ molybdopterin-dependent catalytic subunit